MKNMNDKKLIVIRLSEDEDKKVEEAIGYSVLNGTGFFNVLLKNKLDELDKNQELVFTFCKDHVYKKDSKKKRAIVLDNQLTASMEQICSCTPFSMSALAKYFIMLQVDEIVKRKEWRYIP